jgi:hypothetical protein
MVDCLGEHLPHLLDGKAVGIDFCNRCGFSWSPQVVAPQWETRAGGASPGRTPKIFFCE